MRRLVAVFAVFTAVAVTLDAHGVASRDARLLESVDGPAIAPLLYLGAKHMVTGYDHLLFLAGVVFFLERLRHIVVFVSLFTLGHSITLLAGTLGGIHANPYLIDCVIGLSVVYKAFENMGGLGALGWRLDPRAAVTAFGLCHGLGLSTKLQDLSLSPNGLVTNMLSFNVGVEIGQVLALTVVLTALAIGRTSPRFHDRAFAANVVLMTAGFLLAGYQLAGYVVLS